MKSLVSCKLAWWPEAQWSVNDPYLKRFHSLDLLQYESIFTHASVSNTTVINRIQLLFLAQLTRPFVLRYPKKSNKEAHHDLPVNLELLSLSISIQMPWNRGFF